MTAPAGLAGGLFGVRLTVEGDVVIDQLLSGLEARARNLAPAWPAVVRVFQSIVGKAFATEGASTGAPWAPLKPRTQADRQRRGFPPDHPILARTHALERALTIGQGAFVSMGTERMEYVLSSDVGRYFGFHQSKAPRTRLPRRAPVELTPADRAALVHPVRLWITGSEPSAARLRDPASGRFVRRGA